MYNSSQWGLFMYEQDWLDVEFDSNVGAPDELGDPSGDNFYMLSIFNVRKSVAVTTCGG